jgi:DNA-directed RNA polymerase specialized sigma24 family protein
MLQGAAEELFAAARASDAGRVRDAVAELVPLLEPPVRAAVRRQHALLRQGRVDENDVVQRVFEKLLTHPPENPGGRAPVAVLVAWAKAVALRHLLDMARRGEPASVAGEDDDEPHADVAVAALQEEVLEHRERVRLARVCADTHLARHKHLREVFYALAEDPDLSARDLAVTLGLVPPDGDTEALRRAEQHVFKLRERVHIKLAECFDAAQRVRRPWDRGDRR